MPGTISLFTAGMIYVFNSRVSAELNTSLSGDTLMSYRVDPSQPTATKHVYEKHQNGEVWISPRDGGFDIRVRFENGKTLDGDHFGCRIVFLTINETPVTGIEFRAGVNATFFGHTKSRESNEHFAFSPEQTNSIATIYIELFQFDQHNDVEFWEKVKKVAEVIYRALAEEKKPEAVQPNGPEIRSGGRH